MCGTCNNHYHNHHHQHQHNHYYCQPRHCQPTWWVCKVHEEPKPEPKPAPCAWHHYGHLNVEVTVEHKCAGW
ncbi:hypothetical protein H4R18_002176 [Coemansia javaensis]|uniref:Uncharacterized protein n=1 Tax=Coemansia javaensis TaxID=2761396 RepID=A0A9W8HHI2_9FUNG|nr:hypothetical protein H4R18_002176 [Coemansia javaensis]